MTLEGFRTKILDDGRTLQELTFAETLEALQLVADDIMAGNTTVAHADTLLAMRFGLMDTKTRKTEYNTLQRSAITMGSSSTPAKAAAELGRRGGSKTSEQKAAAARANGRKGGRPRKRYCRICDAHGIVTEISAEDAERDGYCTECRAQGEPPEDQYAPVRP